MSYQLLHITDLHLLGDPAARLHGWRVEHAFQVVLAEAITRYPDYDALVLGGDLVDDRSAAGYRRLNACLARLDRPVLAMAGNHDDPRAMARYLTCAHVHGRLMLGDWLLVALNSHRAGRESGCIGRRALTALEGELARAQTPVVVCVHHPPCALASAWLDAIGLCDAAMLATTLTRYPRVKAVLCGHAHQAAHRCLTGINCWVTPSTMRQFRPASTAFAPDRQRAPGYRWLALERNAALSTGVHRVPAAHAACG